MSIIMYPTCASKHGKLHISVKLVSWKSNTGETQFKTILGTMISCLRDQMLLQLACGP